MNLPTEPEVSQLNARNKQWLISTPQRHSGVEGLWAPWQRNRLTLGPKYLEDEYIASFKNMEDPIKTYKNPCKEVRLTEGYGLSNMAAGGLINPCVALTEIYNPITGRNTMQRLFVQISGSREGVIIPRTTDNMNLMESAQVLELRRDWSGQITGLHFAQKKLELSIVDTNIVTPLPETLDEKKKRLTAARDKAQLEVEELQTQIETL
jgi:hypothetical protein